MADPDNERKSGKTTSEEITQQECTDEKLTEPLDVPDMQEDAPKRLNRPYFQRLRTEWNSEQKMILQRVHGRVEKEIKAEFSDAFEIMYEIYDVVRDRDPDEESGDLWLRTPPGSYVEDWSRLNSRQRERFMFLITTRLFEWEQRTSRINFEALFAKAEWEQSFATGFESLPTISATRPTVDDRTQRARRTSSDDYYFALIKTYYSRRADAIVRTMSAITQRIKDVHTA